MHLKPITFGQWNSMSAKERALLDDATLYQIYEWLLSYNKRILRAVPLLFLVSIGQLMVNAYLHHTWLQILPLCNIACSLGLTMRVALLGYSVLEPKVYLITYRAYRHKLRCIRGLRRKWVTFAGIAVMMILTAANVACLSFAW